MCENQIIFISLGILYFMLKFITGGYKRFF